MYNSIKKCEKPYKNESSLPNHAQNEAASSDNEKSSVAASDHVTESPSATISGKASFSHADEKEINSLNAQQTTEERTADMRKDLHPHIPVTASMPSRSKPSKQPGPSLRMPCTAPETSSPLRHEPLLSPPKAADENESQLSLAHLLEQLAERLEARALR